jgi:probable phosphomutase (TIGR03848 family)
MTTFVFVRHGVTDHTGHRLSGRMEGIHLNDEGRSQAEAVAEQLAGFPLKAIYSSPIDRCYETAEAIAERHMRLEVETTEDLGEVGYGSWTDRPLKSLMRTKLWEVVQRRPSAVTFPDGETFRAVQSRAVNAIESIKQKHRKQTVCCVSHGDVIKLVLAHYLGVHIDMFQRIVVAPASISALSVGDGDPHIWSLNAAPMTIPGRPA